ncbi:uncharacterized protein LOC101211551 [Cucumis sativus]|uniref:Uncharacterized protein n=1 Tax=Cucumis sativus TaxID=3659 RepID=A0A0A0LUB4_CUCSA|nr:uncharacterized protein LOC101211551 [Cucumis sativus]KGN64387.1 hypothetical protein Csa_014226 [Cucumis sativus]
MASSAFKSTTKRTPIGASVPSNDDSASSNRTSFHRRSRSLSRFSHPLPSSPIDKVFGEASPAPRGRFVNTSRGSGFPEISLDDLAVEFFGSTDRGRSAARSSELSGAMNSSVASNRRGRSVSRHGGGKTSGGGCENKGRGGSSVSGGKVVPESNSRRRRSLSVVRYQISDSESDDRSQSSGTRVKEKSFGIGNKQKPISHKTDDSSRRPTLRRSLSQNDFKCHDGYSSHSSVLTDDEGKDASFGNSVIEKTMRSIYARKAKQANGGVVDNGLYEAMRKELRHAVEEIRVELEQEMVNRNSSVETFSDDLLSSDSGVRHHTSPFTRNYSAKQEQPEKRRDSLGKMVMEKQRGQDLAKMVKNLPPDLKNVVADNSSRTRKRSKDRSRMSKRLSEEAEKYIEDFISNVEDTDISSLDGDRSDTSSSLGGKVKPNFKIPAASRYVPPGMDGVLLPWLQWETSNDATPYPRKNMFEPPTTPQTFPWDVNQDTSNAQDLCNHSGSSQGSWSPGVTIGLSGKVVEDNGSRFKGLGKYQNQSYSESRETRFDIDEYLKRPSSEDFLLERWKQQHKVTCSGLLLCNRLFL